MAEFGSNEKIVLTDEEIIKVEALGAYLSIEQVADYLGMSKPTFYAIMERQPEVGLRYSLGKSRAIEGMAKSLIMNGLEGNVTAQMFYLKTRAGWKDQSTIEHTGDVTLRTINRTIVDPKA